MWFAELSQRGWLRKVRCNYNYMETATTSIEPNSARCFRMRCSDCRPTRSRARLATLVASSPTRSTTPEAIYPKEEADFLITKLEKPFWDAEVYVAVYRGNDRIGMFRSHRPIVSAAARGELTTVGDVFPLKH